MITAWCSVGWRATNAVSVFASMFLSLSANLLHGSILCGFCGKEFNFTSWAILEGGLVHAYAASDQAQNRGIPLERRCWEKKKNRNNTRHRYWKNSQRQEPHAVQNDKQNGEARPGPQPHVVAKWIPEAVRCHFHAAGCGFESGGKPRLSQLEEHGAAQAGNGCELPRSGLMAFLNTAYRDPWSLQCAGRNTAAPEETGPAAWVVTVPTTLRGIDSGTKPIACCFETWHGQHKARRTRGTLRTAASHGTQYEENKERMLGGEFERQIEYSSHVVVPRQQKSSFDIKQQFKGGTYTPIPSIPLKRILAKAVLTLFPHLIAIWIKGVMGVN
ncbi:hypothetical protein DFJ77DRAFT_438979 [Powellomyces hirtus]|nr:hypothetical protein DFJ77DRAFT_438979 [Powellomyces hirtus]